MHARFVGVLAMLWVGGCGQLTTTAEYGPEVPRVARVTSQEILTPLPLRVDMPAGSRAESVVVLYRTFGTRGWRELALARSGGQWSGEVSCREVSTVTGETRFFVVALDAAGELVGGSGSPGSPHVASIVASLPDGPRALADGAVPIRCHDPSDCPPDAPGCPAYAMKRSACVIDRDCGLAATCAWDGYCGLPTLDVPTAVSDDGSVELELAVRAVRGRATKKTR